MTEALEMEANLNSVEEFARKALDHLVWPLLVKGVLEELGTR